MTVTAEQIDDLRRMVAEPDDSNGYTTEVLTDLLTKFSLIDERGEVPYTFDTSTEPPTQDANEDWIPTYDLHAAAAEVWQEKAAGKAELYMFSADGGQFMRNQMYDMAMQQARFHLSRRSPKTRRMFMSPAPSRSVVANQVEGEL